jgi:hypothetical protein
VGVDADHGEIRTIVQGSLVFDELRLMIDAALANLRAAPIPISQGSKYSHKHTHN